MSGLLRICTAGNVDDGKSTLIGRLLYDSRGVYEDQISSVQKASKNRSAGPIEFSLFTDGLKAEREQGITIDVAYRYFATSAVEAPVAMLRVYCSCPGVSARMNLRRAVAK